MSRKSRRLTPEEERLWKKIAETATPMQKPKERQPSPLTKLPSPAPHPTFTPQTFRVGERAAPSTRIEAPHHPIRMDRKAFTRLKRGKSSPEARIDLHGMTLATAHTALRSFLLRAHADGKRLVLVITGKGKPSDETDPAPRRAGVLKQQVPHWLDMSPLNQIVLQVTPAHQRHGGSGALYVYLNRRR